MTRQPLTIAGVVVQYWIISISMVLINKALVGSANTSSSDKLSKNDQSSILITWIQCMSASTFSLLFNLLDTRLIRPNVSHDERIVFQDLKRPLFHKMAALFAAMLTLSQLCLRHVGVAFFTIARSTTLVFTVIFSSALLGQRVSKGPVFCCLSITLGFILGVAEEAHIGTMSWLGVFYGVASSVCTALVGVYTKTALDSVANEKQYAEASGSMSRVKLVFLNNALASVYLLVPVLGSGAPWLAVLPRPDCLIATGSGAIGSLVGWAGALQIDYTSPVAHHVSNGCKSAVVSVIGAVVYKETKTLLWWTGCSLVLGGALSYAMIKSSMSSKPVVVLPIVDDKQNSLTNGSPFRSKQAVNEDSNENGNVFGNVFTNESVKLV